MAYEFNRQNVIENLTTLVQGSTMKIGEIEKQLSVSPGYLSRLSKKDNDSALSAEFIWKVSQLFGVSVDTLVNEHIGGEDKTIAYMRRFISRLTSKTSSGELTWTPITIPEINAMLMGDKQPQFPVGLFEDAGFPLDKPALADDPISVDFSLACYGDRKVISAAYGGILVNPQTSVYHVTLADGQDAKELYLACYCTEDEAGPTEFYELMLVDTLEEERWWKSQNGPVVKVYGKCEIPLYVEEVCNTFASVWQPIRDELRDLFQTVRGHEADIQLTDSVKSAIDRFLAE